MTLHVAGKVDEFQELVPKFLNVDGKSVAVYSFKGKFHAYENLCPHQGGPVCEGFTSGRSEAKVSETGRYLEDYTSSTRFVITCPWHGSEYDLQTGFFNDKLKLKSFPVHIEDELVKVEVSSL
ncbi:MAG: Rieske (2Fe-2S) protein [Nitrososphaerales archaeon]